MKNLIIVFCTAVIIWLLLTKSEPFSDTALVLDSGETSLQEYPELMSLPSKEGNRKAQEVVDSIKDQHEVDYVEVQRRLDAALTLAFDELDNAGLFIPADRIGTGVLTYPNQVRISDDGMRYASLDLYYYPNIKRLIDTLEDSK